MLKKYWPSLAIIAVALGVFLYSASSSRDFQYCVGRAGQYPSAQSQDDKLGTVGAPGAAYWWPCGGAFLNANGIAITALATILLAGITYGLVHLGLEQSKTSRAQLRAYVFPERLGIVDRNGVPVGISTIKNTGPTPAYDVRHWADITFCAVGAQDTYKAPDRIEGLVPTSIGPGGELSVDRPATYPLNPSQILALAAPPTPLHMLMIYGKITYRDVFNVDHETTYKVAYAGAYPPVHGVPLVYVTGGSTVT